MYLSGDQVRNDNFRRFQAVAKKKQLSTVLIFEGFCYFSCRVTEKLLTFALGRGVEYYDAPAVRAIVRDAKADEYRFASLILGIVKSVPFQMRNST